MLLLLLGALIASQNAAQAPGRRADTRTWYQAYADGKRAFDQKNWQAAVDSLEASKRAGAPKAGRKIPFYGDVYDDYIPDFYLGVAYANLKQYQRADAALAAVRASGLISPKDREYAELQRQAAAVTAGLRDTAQLAQASPPGGAAGNAAQTPPPAASGNLSAGGNAPAAGVANPPPVAAANPPPPIATSPPGTVQSQQQPIASSANAGGLAAQQPPPSTAPGQGARGRSAQPGRPAPPPSSASGSAIVRVNEEDAIRAYLSGQYQQASAMFTSSVTGATPRAYFYLACSRTALAILGQGGTAGVDEAKQLLARAGDPRQFAADRRYISPRVLQMLGLTP